MIRIPAIVPGRATRVMLALSVGTLMTIGVPTTAMAAPRDHYSQMQSQIARNADELERFYASRDNRPLWLTPDGRVAPAVDRLLELVDTAQFDALDGDALERLRSTPARRALDRAMGGKPAAIAKADLEVSKLFAAYVRAMRGAPRADMLYESAALMPAIPTPDAVLASAAEARSLDAYVADIGWMHPYYAPLRRAMMRPDLSPERRDTVWENLARVRTLPGTPPERYVLVDAASAKLWMYEDGLPVGSMNVVVGRPDTATPAMAGFIRHAIVNPYWNVPPDLVQKNIATNVAKRGVRWLKAQGYEVLSHYGDGGELIDPTKVDWKAVSQGAPGPYVRQKPGGRNFMGKVKYEFPNAQGIYLHDTPDRALLKLDERQLSNGCVRLEDADRLGRWLMGKSIAKTGPTPEQKINLPTPVPVFITYLTAAPTEKGIVFRSDVYGRDFAGARMALARAM